MLKKIIFIALVVIVAAAALNYKSVIRALFPLHYRDLVEKYSEQYHLDPILVYSVVKVESNFSSNAKSSKGAVGLMQITPKTGKYISRLLGEKQFEDEMLNDPEINIKFGCFYLSKLYRDFEENKDAVLAAYNGGEGNMRKWMQKNSWSAKECINVDSLPFAETRNYIRRVNKYYKLYDFLYGDDKRRGQ